MLYVHNFNIWLVKSSMSDFMQANAGMVMTVRTTTVSKTLLASSEGGNSLDIKTTPKWLLGKLNGPALESLKLG